MAKGTGTDLRRGIASRPALAARPCLWGQTVDQIYNRDMLTEAQNVTLDGVIEAHDPSKELPPEPETQNVVLYEHENRLRALEGTPPLTLVDFVEKVSAIGQRK